MRTSEERLDDILAATRDGTLIVAFGHNRFINDPILIRAAKNIISEIGEAAKAIDDTILDDIPGVPWRAIKGMRDKVVHEYPELDVDLLWDTLERGLPVLHRAVNQHRRRGDHDGVDHGSAGK